MHSKLSVSAPPLRKDRLLGPFIGETTHTSVRFWVHKPLFAGDPPQEIGFSIHKGNPAGDPLDYRPATLKADTLGAGTVTFDGLEPDTTYQYRLWAGPGVPLLLPDLDPALLHFRTLPAQMPLQRLDFLLLSCHDPAQSAQDGHEGFRMWSSIEQIKEQNDLRFALLIGDQIYGDHIQEEALAERDETERLRLYLAVYQKLWDHPVYRRVLCSLPSYLMWDDHDITDGWGSRSDSYVDAYSPEFRPEWKDLFRSARTCFQAMQASRNPPPLSTNPGAGFDFCFELGRVGFAMTDLRSHRNVRKHQVWSREQIQEVTRWISEHRSRIDVLFFVSPVVFTHGWPPLETPIRKVKSTISHLSHFLTRLPGVRNFRPMERLIKRNIQDVGGFRDDLEDAWTSDPNRDQAEEILDFLFGLQNPADGSPGIPVFILSGDIHAAGYSMLYSRKPEHRRKAVIEHICSSPVASQPMHWAVEALYQSQVKWVAVGNSGSFSAQVSHHHCQRNVVVLSLRRYEHGELQLKIKTYLEERPQPVILVSDLNRVSHWEGISWENQAPGGAKSSAQRRSPFRFGGRGGPIDFKNSSSRSKTS